MVSKLRLEALQGIAGNKKPKCVCCKEANLVFLTFDHIRGGGARQRKEYRNAPIYKIVRSIKHHTGAWPTDDFRILCNNCNLAVHILKGKCIHERNRDERNNK
jgi:hypothetical protein